MEPEQVQEYSVAAAKKGVGHRENEDCTALYFSIKGREGIKQIEKDLDKSSIFQFMQVLGYERFTKGYKICRQGKVAVPCIFFILKGKCVLKQYAVESYEKCDGQISIRKRIVNYKKLSSVDSFGGEISLEQSKCIFPYEVSVESDEVECVMVRGEHNTVLKKYLKYKQDSQKTRMIRSWPIFKDRLTSRQVASLSNFLKPRVFKCRQIVYSEGDVPPFSLFIILSGRFQISKKSQFSYHFDKQLQNTPFKFNPSSQDQKLAVLSQGGCFGEEEILRKINSRQNTIVCESAQGELFEIQASDFLKVLSTEFREEDLKYLQAQKNMQQQWRESNAQQIKSIKQNYADYLSEPPKFSTEAKLLTTLSNTNQSPTKKINTLPCQESSYVDSEIEFFLQELKDSKSPSETTNKFHSNFFSKSPQKNKIISSDKKKQFQEKNLKLLTTAELYEGSSGKKNQEDEDIIHLESHLKSNTTKKESNFHSINKQTDEFRSTSYAFRNIRSRQVDTYLNLETKQQKQMQLMNLTTGGRFNQKVFQNKEFQQMNKTIGNRFHEQILENDNLGHQSSDMSTQNDNNNNNKKKNNHNISKSNNNSSSNSNSNNINRKNNNIQIRNTQQVYPLLYKPVRGQSSDESTQKYCSSIIDTNNSNIFDPNKSKRDEQNQSIISKSRNADSPKKQILNGEYQFQNGINFNDNQQKVHFIMQDIELPQLQKRDLIRKKISTHLVPVTLKFREAERGQRILNNYILNAISKKNERIQNVNPFGFLEESQIINDTSFIFTQKEINTQMKVKEYKFSDSLNARKVSRVRKRSDANYDRLFLKN